MPSPKQKRGYAGEEIAVQELERLGFELLARNVRSPITEIRGEIDIIVRKGCELHFVEVKTREGSEFGPAIESLSDGKKSMIRQTVRALLEAHPEWRVLKPFFSFFAIDIDTVSGEITKEFVPDAFF